MDNKLLDKFFHIITDKWQWTYRLIQNDSPHYNNVVNNNGTYRLQHNNNVILIFFLLSYIITILYGYLAHMKSFKVSMLSARFKKQSSTILFFFVGGGGGNCHMLHNIGLISEMGYVIQKYLQWLTGRVADSPNGPADFLHMCEKKIHIKTSIP